MHREIKRRTDVINCLVSAVIVEQHDEWQVAERRYLAEGSMATLMQPPEPLPAPARTRRRLAS